MVFHACHPKDAAENSLFLFMGLSIKDAGWAFSYRFFTEETIRALIKIQVGSRSFSHLNSQQSRGGSSNKGYAGIFRYESRLRNGSWLTATIG